jgi:hypothetical protein
MKIKWHPLILTGLIVILASSCVLAGGCGRKTQTEEPKFGPLEPPFSEIIPSAEDLSLPLFTWTQVEAIPGEITMEQALDMQKQGKLTWVMLPKSLQQGLLVLQPELAELYKVAQVDSAMSDTARWKHWSGAAQDFYNSRYQYFEYTIYYTDSIIGYSRQFANESACRSLLPNTTKPESPSVVLSMLIYKYQDEEQAKKRIQRERRGRLYDESVTKLYTMLFGFPPEDIAGQVTFWKEPTYEQVQGEEKAFFRVGQYVGDYSFHVYDLPKDSDGYFMPSELHDLLAVAVTTTIPRLRAIAGTVGKGLELPYSRYCLRSEINIFRH